MASQTRCLIAIMLLQEAATAMQRKVWRPRSSVDLAADVVEKVLQTGVQLDWGFPRSCNCRPACEGRSLVNPMDRSIYACDDRQRVS